VISRGSVMQFKDTQRPPTPEIAKMFDVDAIVEGVGAASRRHGADHGPAWPSRVASTKPSPRASTSFMALMKKLRFPAPNVPG